MSREHTKTEEFRKKISIARIGERANSMLRNKDWIIDQYCNKRISSCEIGRQIGVGGGTVKIYLRKYGIPKEDERRWPKSEEFRKVISERTKKAMRRKGVKEKHAASLVGKYTEEWRDNQRRVQLLAHKNDPSIKERMRQKALDRWRDPKRRRKIIKELRNSKIGWSPWNKGLDPTKQPNWQGGKSFEPYCSAWSDSEYKKSILDRDKNGCRNPLCVGGSKRLGVHHIDYNKKNCHPNNLITLCYVCHGKTVHNYEYWKTYYRCLVSTDRIREGPEVCLIRAAG